MNLRAGYVEDLAEKTTRYVNFGRIMEIEDEISMISQGLWKRHISVP